jgi:transmembrane sensor
VSRLPVPVRDALPRPREDDPAAIDRVWRGVQRKRAARARRAPRARWIAVIAAAAAAVFLIVWPEPSPFAVDRGELSLAGGGAIATLDAPEPSGRDVTLSDGSHIELSSGARLEPLDNGPTRFSTLLARGRATFDVRPGGPRRWVIECGLVSVEVLGTRFSVERRADGARIEVERGVVLVRGERVPDHVQRLTAGASLDVVENPPGPTPTLTPSPTLAPVPTVAPTPSVAPPVTPPSSPAASTAGWRGLAQRGDHASAYAELGPAGIASASQGASVDDLLALADVARLSGHPADAVAPLSRVVAEHADDPRAPLAAFTLGRVQLDALGNPGAAADSFARALALGLPQSLQEDAYARLVEARAKAGDGEGARAAAQQYEQRFPAGKRLGEVRRWSGPP